MRVFIVTTSVCVCTVDEEEGSKWLLLSCLLSPFQTVVLLMENISLKNTEYTIRICMTMLSLIFFSTESEKLQFYLCKKQFRTKIWLFLGHF